MKSVGHTEDFSQFTLSPEDNDRLANLCGQLSEHIRVIEDHLGVSIRNRGHDFKVTGPKSAVAAAKKVLHRLYDETNKKNALTPYQVHMSLQSANEKNSLENPEDTFSIYTMKGNINAKNKHQQQYLQRMVECDVNFAIGPAGTGKTFLAVACAAAALDREEKKRIILVRPAVEAGESLGFLPGDFSQKVEPYLRPLYDALYELMGFDWVAKHIEQNAIEVAPLAYMRGRTLNDAFIILDEAQNTTIEQMKMFLTRLGFGSTAVITGDLTQVDLPGGKKSGLQHALHVLSGVEGISVTEFTAKDAVRHRLVQAIIEAYDKYESN